MLVFEGSGQIDMDWLGCGRLEKDASQHQDSDLFSFRNSQKPLMMQSMDLDISKYDNFGLGCLFDHPMAGL